MKIFKFKLKPPKLSRQLARDYFNYSLLCVKSLCYNEHLSQSYIAGKEKKINFWNFFNFINF